VIEIHPPQFALVDRHGPNEVHLVYPIRLANRISVSDFGNHSIDAIVDEVYGSESARAWGWRIELKPHGESLDLGLSIGLA
jgi:hypothetical protein